ncbi:MAG: FAD-linked oxidase C-terminal domain-containing protein, partial [Pseudomonadota bacterium]
KSASGYDLTKLFVGSEGTLGVFTEITLKITPRPTVVSTGMASFGELVQAGQAVGEIMESGILPSVCELLDKNTIQLLIDRAGLDLMPSEAMILVETDGCTPDETDFQMEKILGIFERNGAVRIRKAESSEEAEELWKARRSIGSVLGSVMPNFLVEDVTVPVSKLTLLIRGIEDIARETQVLIVNFGHAGDGNLHPHLLYDGKNREEAKKVEKATAALFHLTCELGGTLSGEHGIGLLKAPFMALEHDPASLEVMRSLKRLIDPGNILNPGKMGL